jgi:hypothetical protein
VSLRQQPVACFQVFEALAQARIGHKLLVDPAMSS